jgi:hypothetical protein
MHTYDHWTMEAAIGLGGIVLGSLLTWAASLYGAKKEADREHDRWLRDQRLAACTAMTTAVARCISAARGMEAILRMREVDVTTIDDDLRAINATIDEARDEAHAAYATIQLLGTDAIQRPTMNLFKVLDDLLEPELTQEERLEIASAVATATNDFNAAAFDMLRILED